MWLFAAGALFREVQASLFVAGAHLVKFECHFSRQVHYLAKFNCHFSGQVHYFVKFTWHTIWWLWKVSSVALCIVNDVAWKSFFVAGEVFGDVGGWVLLLRIYDDDLSSEPFFVAGAVSGDGCKCRLIMWQGSIMRVSFSWQAQYLVSLEGGFCCSAHCKRRFLCEEDLSWEPFVVAGTVFGDFGGWHLLLRALWMTFHVLRLQTWMLQFHCVLHHRGLLRTM